MSDLSNLLGDVYGSSSPDESPVRREAAAHERAFALSNDGPVDPQMNSWVPGEAGRFGEVSASALSAQAAPAPALPPTAPAPGPVPRALWAAPIDLPARADSPVLQMAGSTPSAPSWMPGDDDIVPMGKVKNKNKKK